MGLPLSAVGLAMGGVQAGLGVYQAFQSSRALKNLQGQPMPQYSLSPEFQSYYNTTRDRSSRGFDPSETAAFNQNVAQQQNTGYRQGVQMAGGNLAQALSAGFASQNLGAMNKFAADDANQKRQNIAQWGQAAGDMQQQQNLINQQKIQRRTMLEQAYGGALQAGLNNISSGLMSGMGLGFKGMGLDQNKGGKDITYGSDPANYGFKDFGNMYNEGQ